MRGRKVGDDQLARHPMGLRGHAGERLEVANVLATIRADKWSLHRAHSGVFEVDQFAAISQQCEHSCEDRLCQHEWEIVERQAADDKVVSAVKRRLLDRTDVQSDRHTRVPRSKWLEQSMLKVLAEHRIDFDDVERIMSAHRIKNLLRERAGSGTNFKNPLLASMLSQRTRHCTGESS